MPDRLNRASETQRPVETPLRAEQFRVALQSRYLGLAGLDEAENIRALLLERGEARLRLADGSVLPLSGPVMGWFPWQPQMRLELEAGAQGTHLLLGRATLNRTLARSPETADLGFLAERSLSLRLAPEDGAMATIAACFAGILSETLRPGQLNATVVESFLRILLVHLHRGQLAGSPVAGPSGSGQGLANRFTTLVEGHLHERWPVARYATALGVSPDRLTDICMRAYGRPPGQLIRERLALEARVYLEQSSLTLDQIAGVLGFAGGPQFNRFFSDMAGMPPGRYRAAQRRARDRSPGDAGPGALYSWP